MTKKIDFTKEDTRTLNEQIITMREELRTARFSLGAEGKNTKASRNLRRTIARIFTELTRRSRQV